MKPSTFSIIHAAFQMEMECLQKSEPYSSEILNSTGRISLGGNHSPSHIDMIQDLSRHINFPDTTSHFTLITIPSISDSTLCLVNDSGVYRARKVFEERRTIYHHYKVDNAPRMNLKTSQNSVEVALEKACEPVESENCSTEMGDKATDEETMKGDDERKEEAKAVGPVEGGEDSLERKLTAKISYFFKNPPKNESTPNGTSDIGKLPSESVEDDYNVTRNGMTKSAPPRSFFMRNESIDGDADETEHLLKHNDSPDNSKAVIKPDVNRKNQCGNCTYL